jgi:outer membrane protein assembly factor BamB
MRLTFSLMLLSAMHLSAADWVHWRGPMQTGEAHEPAVPKTFSLAAEGKDGLLWKKPVGGRSSPLVLGGKVYTINAFDPGELTEGERITCFNADTGEVLWHYNVNVYHAEVVTSRLGWTTLTADPATGTVYAHTTAGALIALNSEGKVVWQRHLSEEFGRFTGYGGRIVSPLFDSGLVICAIVNSSWGDMARGGNRFIAFDGKSGAVVWISEPTVVNFGTYQSTPVVAVINGQRLLIAGGANGALNAMKVRTGELVWTYRFATGVINPSPVVDGTLVYGAHAEENPEGGPLGRVVCVDASKIENGKPKLVWEFRKANRFGLSHPAIADGRLYSSALTPRPASCSGNTATAKSPAVPR